MRETEPSAMLVADAGLLADEGVFRAIRLHDGALAGGAALELLRAVIVGGVGRDITFASGEEDACGGENNRGNKGFHAGV